MQGNAVVVVVDVLEQSVNVLSSASLLMTSSTTGPPLDVSECSLSCLTALFKVLKHSELNDHFAVTTGVVKHIRKAEEVPK